MAILRCEIYCCYSIYTKIKSSNAVTFLKVFTKPSTTATVSKLQYTYSIYCRTINFNYFVTDLSENIIGHIQKTL